MTTRPKFWSLPWLKLIHILLITRYHSKQYGLRTHPSEANNKWINVNPIHQLISRPVVNQKYFVNNRQLLLVFVKHFIIETAPIHHPNSHLLPSPPFHRSISLQSTHTSHASGLNSKFSRSAPWRDRDEDWKGGPRCRCVRNEIFHDTLGKMFCLMKCISPSSSSSYVCVWLAQRSDATLRLPWNNNGHQAQADSQWCARRRWRRRKKWTRQGESENDLRNKKMILLIFKIV